jgi:hypothetical protein
MAPESMEEVMGAKEVVIVPSEEATAVAGLAVWHQPEAR